MVSSRAHYLLVEIIIRVVMFAVYWISEDLPPFTRIIQKEEWWLYRNPIAQHEVCPSKMLLAIAICSPLVVIAIVHFVRRKKNSTAALLAVTLAIPLNGVVTNYIKLMVGRPRPDFFFRCFPEGKFPKGQPSPYDLQCTGDENLIMEGRKSFPSGHSSFVFTGLGFCTLYLAGQLKCFSATGRGSSWRLLLSFLPVAVALGIAVSRTSDYRHHWQDVVVGSLLGSLVSYMCYRQHYPRLSHDESDMPYMRTDPSDLSHAKSMDRLQSVYTKRDV